METETDGSSRGWMGAALLVAAVYVIIGIAFAALAGAAASNQARVTWRLMAWLLSAAAFAGQIAYEDVRFRNAPARIALHAALAVALGAFALALAALLHSRADPTRQHRVMLALVIWPIMTGLPAFLVAWAAAAALRIRARRSKTQP